MPSPDTSLTLSCLVVDDEELARQLLGTYIERMPNLELIASCKNPLEASSWLGQGVDLLFLDIQMPEMTGIQWIKTLSRKPQIILTTAYPEYALESYQLEVTDYLLKPFSFERFMQAVQKAAEWKRLRTQSPPTIPQEQTGSTDKDYLMVKSGGKLVRIRLDDLLWIQGKGEYVQYHTNSGNTLVLESLKSLEEALPSESFMRIHKSWIVRLDAIDVMEGSNVTIAGEKIPVGARYRDSLRSAF